MTEQEQDEHLKKCLSIIDNWAEKNKPPTLYQIIHDNLGYSHDCTQEIIDAVEQWLPREDPRAWVGDPWNRCVKRMKEKLQ
jgi:hypothetical protein